MNQLPEGHNSNGERDAVISEIYAAWSGVTREGGISWSESAVYDNYGTKEEALIARLQDKEQNWRSLVDDPDWNENLGNGGFGMRDAIFFRYYLAPALIRCVRSTTKEGFNDSPLCFWLEFDAKRSEGEVPEEWRLLDSRQRSCTARALRFIASNCNEFDAETWWNTYNSYWKQFDNPQ